MLLLRDPAAGRHDHGHYDFGLVGLEPHSHGRFLRASAVFGPSGDSFTQ